MRFVPLPVIVPRPGVPVVTEYVSLKGWPGFNTLPIEALSLVPVTAPAPLNVATPELSETFCSTWLVVPKKNVPFKDAFVNGLPVCDSTKPDSTELDGLNTNPWFGLTR